ncbi:MAG: acyltransferase [Candidatus Roizmanbacteria bacterium]|nr:acyltransferase [Candidatus Roizmanbacteria bacterium]
MRYFLFTIYSSLRYAYHKIFAPFFKIGRGVMFSRGARIVHPRYIQIGNKVLLDSQCLLQVNLYGRQNNPRELRLKIGDNVTVGKGCVINAVNDIEIEDSVGIAPYCYIADNSHCFDRVDMPIKKQGLDKINPVKIKSGAWLGWNVVVLPGVTIGKNSVIGAHSVVNKDIPDYCVAVGTPAKIVKKFDHASGEWVSVKNTFHEK